LESVFDRRHHLTDLRAIAKGGVFLRIDPSRPPFVLCAGSQRLSRLFAPIGDSPCENCRATLSRRACLACERQGVDSQSVVHARNVVPHRDRVTVPSNDVCNLPPRQHAPICRQRVRLQLQMNRRERLVDCLVVAISILSSTD
jgi:hypothetical protein